MAKPAKNRKPTAEPGTLAYRAQADPVGFFEAHVAGEHIDLAHVSANDVALLNNVLSKKKLGDSKFENQDVAKDAMVKTLLANMAVLQEYLKEPFDPAKASIVLSHDMTERVPGKTGKQPLYVGHGFVNRNTGPRNPNISHVSSVKTNRVGIVVRRTETNPDGFEITSGFPMVAPKREDVTQKGRIVPHQKDFSGLLKDTFTYQRATPLKKAYLEYACAGGAFTDSKLYTLYSPPEKDIRTDDPDHVPREQVLITLNDRRDAPAGDRMTGTGQEDAANIEDKPKPARAFMPSVRIFNKPGRPAYARFYQPGQKSLDMTDPRTRTKLTAVMPEILGVYDRIVASMPTDKRPVPRTDYVRSADDMKEPETVRELDKTMALACPAS